VSKVTAKKVPQEIVTQEIPVEPTITTLNENLQIPCSNSEGEEKQMSVVQRRRPLKAPRNSVS
jgi:hypothetical protein